MNTLKTEVKRINGYLKEVTTFLDSSGQPISHIINPIMTEMKPRDALQIFIGATIFGAPLCYTEEIWNLSVSIPTRNIIVLNIVGALALLAFIYFNFYRYKIKGNVVNYIKRSLAVFIITYTSITVFLLLIGKLPYHESYFLAYKRISLISFPCLFSAVLSDMLK